MLSKKYAISHEVKDNGHPYVTAVYPDRDDCPHCRADRDPFVAQQEDWVLVIRLEVAIEASECET